MEYLNPKRKQLYIFQFNRNYPFNKGSSKEGRQSQDCLSFFCAQPSHRGDPRAANPKLEKTSKQQYPLFIKVVFV